MGGVRSTASTDGGQTGELKLMRLLCRFIIRRLALLDRGPEALARPLGPQWTPSRRANDDGTHELW